MWLLHPLSFHTNTLSHNSKHTFLPHTFLCLQQKSPMRPVIVKSTAGDSLYGGLLPINAGPPCSEEPWCTKTKRLVCNLSQCLLPRPLSSILPAAGGQGAHGEPGTRWVSPSQHFIFQSCPNPLFSSPRVFLVLPIAQIVTFKCILRQMLTSHCILTIAIWSQILLFQS